MTKIINCETVEIDVLLLLLFEWYHFYYVLKVTPEN